jgi:hypothetical protein
MSRIGRRVEEENQLGTDASIAHGDDCGRRALGSSIRHRGWWAELHVTCPAKTSNCNTKARQKC